MPKLLARFLSRRHKPLLPARTVPAPAQEEAADALPGRLWALFSAQGPVSLADRERRRLGGLLFADAPLLVSGVATALEDRPDLFQDAAPRAARLRRGGRRALFWRALHHQLARMARMAADSYLAELGLATAEAMRVVDEARHEARDPALPPEARLPGGRPWQQQLALHDALAVLGRRERRKHKTRLAHRRADRKAALAEPAR